MHIECNLTKFRNAVEWVAKSLDARPMNASHGGIRLTVAEDDKTSLSVTATGQDHSSHIVIPVVTETAMDVVISGKLLAEIVKLVKGDLVTFSSNENPVRKVSLKIGKLKYVLPTLSVENYPLAPNYPDTIGSVNGKAFLVAARRAKTAAAADGSALPVLAAVQMHVDPNTKLITLAATDRYRLAVSTVPYVPSPNQQEPTTMLLAGKEVVDAAFHDETLDWAAGGASNGVYGVKGAGRQFTGRLVTGQFPEWGKLISTATATTSVIINAAEMADCIKRVALVAVGETPRVQVKFANNMATISIHDDGGSASAEDSLTVTHEGADFDAVYNAKYLAAAFTAVGSSTTIFTGNESSKPALVSLYDTEKKAVDPSYKYLVMPVK